MTRTSSPTASHKNKVSPQTTRFIPTRLPSTNYSMFHSSDRENKSTETEDTFNALSIDEGVVPPTSENRSGAALKNRVLSMRSQQYDVDGDGKLDDIEKAMMEMDGENRGHLSNEKVYQIMREQMQTQKDLFNMKRLMIVLFAFTTILALSNLGTAWAAATLAKDTRLDSNGVMVSTNGQNEVVGVKIENKAYGIVPLDDERRHLALENGDTALAQTGVMSLGDAGDLFNRCDGGGNAFIKRACGEDPTIMTTPVCGSSGGGYTESKSQGKTTWTYRDDGITVGPCGGSETECPVNFDLDMFPCVGDGPLVFLPPPDP
jgi:hypothetical protein